MRLIDADALIEKSLEDAKDFEGNNDIKRGYHNCQMLMYDAPTIDAEPVVRCKDCKWYDPPHIDHGGGKRTDVEDDAPLVPISVGINVGGRCMSTLRERCLNHDREDPDDYECLVKFRERMDYCSDGERKDDDIR